MPTIGERIDELTEEYCEMYHEYRASPITGIKSSTIATHDARVQKYIWGKVYENVQKYVEGWDRVLTDEGEEK